MSDSLQPHECSPPGSSVHEILQARILEWVAISSSRGSSRLRDQTHVFFFFLLFLPWFLSHDPLHLPAIESAVEGQKDLLGSHHWDKPMSFKSPALAGGFFTTSATWEAQVKTHNFIIVTRCHVGQKVHWSNSLRTNLNELFGQPNRYKNFTAEYFFLISLSLFSQKLHEGRDDYLLPSSVPGTQQVSESYSNESVHEISCSKKATDIVRKPRK